MNGLHWNHDVAIHPPPKTVKDLTNVRFGKFVVIGFLTKRRKKNGTDKKIWLVKCDCGRYETRRSKAILNPKNSNDKCKVCRDNDFINNIIKEWQE